jgi:uncharacterized protein YggE
MWKLGQSIERAIGVTAYGSAVLRTEPDVAVTWLQISRTEKDPGSVFEAVRDAAKSVRDVFSKAGIDPTDVEVSRVGVQAEFEYPDRKLRGYRADIGFSVRVREVDLVEPVLVDAVAAGAHEIRTLTYETSKLRELREDARRQAVAAARRKAEVYCDAAGCHLGAVLHVEDVDPETAVWAGRDAPRIASPLEASDAGSLGSGSLSVTAAVLVAYAILPAS